jgi:glyoxylase-like metal-dependent hydrolase (beta-lactamase superfamily II)
MTMDADLPSYELFAIRFATRPARRADHFIGGDPHDGPMPMDYFVWVARGAPGTFVIDTGFTAPVAEKRNRTWLRCPVDSLAMIGVDATEIRDVILTHLHYDHVGNFHRFPQATFHLQEQEIHFATGRYMRYRHMSHAYEVDDVCGIVKLNHAQRVAFHNGAETLAPGLQLIPTGGHSGGLQFVRVHTKRGWVALASDVTHFYENISSQRPFTLAVHVGEMLEGFDALRKAADSTAHIVPGHDPLVMALYPAPMPALEGIVVRLDEQPRRDPIAEAPQPGH